VKKHQEKILNTFLHPFCEKALKTSDARQNANYRRNESEDGAVQGLCFLNAENPYQDAPIHREIHYAAQMLNSQILDQSSLYKPFNLSPLKKMRIEHLNWKVSSVIK